MTEPSKHFRKRDAILACLKQSKAHPSAEAIYRQLQQTQPDISLATVYRNLALFKEQGLIISLGTIDGIERFDGRLDPHVHFACSCCGRVEDLPETMIPDTVSREAADLLGCRVDGIQLMLTGRCKACLESTPDM